MIKISKRLEKIASLVEDNSKIVDIGCDHGLLDIYIANKYEKIKIIASDLRETALSGAKNNIKKNNLEHIIETRLGSGLEVVEKDEIDTVIMSGLGAYTIVEILNQGLNKLEKVNTILIQSNNHLEYIRKRITKLGYYIENEKLVKDSGIIYTIIKFKKGHKYYNHKELQLGPILIKENSNLFKEKKERELIKTKKIYEEVPWTHIKYKIELLFKMSILK